MKWDLTQQGEAVSLTTVSYYNPNTDQSEPHSDVESLSMMGIVP